MKTPQQILDFIINHQHDYEICINELYTQLQLAELQGIIKRDNVITGGDEESNLINSYFSKGTIHNRESERIIEIPTNGTNEC